MPDGDDIDDVEYHEADGIAYLTLNRPAKINALGPNSFRLEQAVGAVLYGTDDAREGIAAFTEKRKPRFSGH